MCAAYVVTVAEDDQEADDGERFEFRLDQEQELKQFIMDQIRAGHNVYGNFPFLIAPAFQGPDDIEIVAPPE